jgi:hypothetical protein
LRTISSTSASPRPTRVPAARAAPAAIRPGAGATTSALPPARGSIVPGTRTTARRVPDSTRAVAKSSVHCCSLRNEVAPSSLSVTAARAVSSIGMDRHRADPVLVAEASAVQFDRDLIAPRGRDRDVQTEDPGRRGGVDLEPMNRLPLEADDHAPLAQGREVRKIGQVDREPRLFARHERRVLHEQFGLLRPGGDGVRRRLVGVRAAAASGGCRRCGTPPSPSGVISASRARCHSFMD